MSETIQQTWRRLDAQVEELHRKNLERARKRGGADRDFAEAVDLARRGAKADDLFPTRTEFGELRYTLRQGLKAACCGREDAAATLAVQLPMLKRLEAIRRLAWVCAALLAYVAYQVS